MHAWGRPERIARDATRVWMEWTGRLLVGVSRSALSTTRSLLDRTWVYAGAACWLLLGFKQSTICRGKQGPAPLSGARYWLHLHPLIVITAPVRRCVAWRVWRTDGTSCWAMHKAKGCCSGSASTSGRVEWSGPESGHPASFLSARARGSFSAWERHRWPHACSWAEPTAERDDPDGSRVSSRHSSIHVVFTHMRMFTTPSSLPICTRPPDDLTACVVAIGPRRLLLHSAHCSASVECCCFHMDGMRFSFSRCVSVSVCGASTYAWKRTARVRTSTSVLMSSTHYICNFIKDVCSVILIFNQQQKKINMEKKAYTYREMQHFSNLYQHRWCRVMDRILFFYIKTRHNTYGLSDFFLLPSHLPQPPLLLPPLFSSTLHIFI